MSPKGSTRGFHLLLYSEDPAADRAFLRDVVGLPAIDTGGGWLIFALPPSELGVHPMETEHRHGAFLMCEDLGDALSELTGRGARTVGEVTHDEGVGRFATIVLPGGGTLGIYQPEHPTPLPGWPTTQAPDAGAGSHATGTEE